MDGILFTLFHARVIFERTVGAGDGGVGFLNAGDHFGVNICLKFCRLKP